MRRATLEGHAPQPPQGISIHALLAESDLLTFYDTAQHTYFYPRSPCGERPVTTLEGGSDKDFYPRSPCGERRGSKVIIFSITHFYPRSPCGERHSSVNTADKEARFLSTLSLRRATFIFCSTINTNVISIHALLAESDVRVYELVWGVSISIHALLAESDRPCVILSNGRAYFYPRSPCGERPMGLDGRFKL